MNEQQTAWLQSIAQAAVELQSEAPGDAKDSLLLSRLLKDTDDALQFWLDALRGVDAPSN